MKSHRYTTLLALTASFALLAGPVTAAGKSAPTASQASENEPEWADLFGDASLPIVWQSTLAASEKIAAAVKAKDLAGVPDWAETIHLGAHALADQVKLPDPEQQKRFRGALAQAARLADTVMDGANHNDVEKTAAAYQRMKSALALAQTRLPNEVTEAPKQAVRFAKAPKHEGHGHAH